MVSTGNSGAGGAGTDAGAPCALPPLPAADPGTGAAASVWWNPLVDTSIAAGGCYLWCIKSSGTRIQASLQPPHQCTFSGPLQIEGF